MRCSQRAETVHTACSEQWPGDRLEKTQDGRTLVILAAPGLILDDAGDAVGVDAWVQLYDTGGAEIPIDPHRRIINPPTKNRTGEPDPAAAFYEAVWDSVAETPNPAGHGTAGTVTTIFGDTTDGRLEGSSATYSTARQGTGTINIDTSGVTSATGQFFSSTYSCYQQYWAFNTSSISDTDIVSAVDLALWMTADQSATDFTIEAREKDWGTSLTTADYTSGSTLANFTLLASLATSGIGAAGYKTFTSQAAFLTTANLKTGTVRLFTSSSRQRGNNTPTGNEYVQFSAADTTGTTQDPKLTITHTAPPEEHDGGSEATVTATATGAGSPAVSGGSSTGASITATGAGSPAIEAGAQTGMTVSASGAGSPSFSGGSTATLDITATGAGALAVPGGSTAVIEALATGGGSPGFDDGSTSTVAVTSEGAGSPAFVAGSTAVVEVVATGAGVGPPATGGSQALVTVTATGGGKLAVSGGSTAGMTVTATGHGRVVLVDLSIAVGPTRVLERATVGATRTSWTVGDTTQGLAAAATRLRERVTAAATRVRERVEVGPTRTSYEVGDTRTGLEAGPTRNERGG